MARATCLADTSTFARLTNPLVVAAFAPLIAQGQIALCAPVVSNSATGTRLGRPPGHHGSS